MASTGEICNELGIKRVDLNYGLCEHLSHYFYLKDPLPSLEFKQHCILDLDKKFDLKGVDFREIMEWETFPARPTYPETYT